MKPTTPNMRLLYLATIVMCVVLSLTGARGDDKPANPLKIAVVNAAKLINEYKYTVKSSEELNKKKDDIVTELNSWDQHRYLPEGDQRALGAIAVKEQNKIELTDAEKATKKRLEETSKQLFDEYLALQTNKAPTPQDSARMKALNQLEADTGTRIKASQAAAQAALQKQADDAQTKMDKDVHDTIVKVAKSKGVNLVFSSQVVYYCETDLTDDVLKELNR